MMNTDFSRSEAKGPHYNQADLERIYHSAPMLFRSPVELKEWLTSCKVDLALADSKKGLEKLFGKIEKGEARLVYDEGTATVLRIARVAKIDVEVTIHGERYPLVELCQVFLNQEINESDLTVQDPAEVTAVLSKLDIRSAHVRDSQELWETLIAEEDAVIGARRGLVEELNYTEAEAGLATLHMKAPTLQYEQPVDWPGIHSVLEINSANAILPESISKPAYVELEAGDQITIFIATPGAPVIRSLLGKIIPNIHYLNPSGS
ncbi:MAG: hypothetical protein KDD62_16450 [Bdellovibrionales bacterium]|nr:hypothetical protein [Bdellovibrionales bacterium]